MNPVSSLSETLSVFDALLIAILGYAVVFFGLILLMYVVIGVGKFFIAQENKKKEADTNA